MTTEDYTVLDKGFVKLVEYMGSDLLVVNAARVSFDKISDWERKSFTDENEANEWGTVDYDYVYSDRWSGNYPSVRLSEKDSRLIKYLAKHNHWTPFAHPQVCLHIKAPIFVRTQLFKHKQGLVENEISRRYVDSEPEFYWPTEWRERPEGSVKQGSGVVLPRCLLDEMTLELEWKKLYNYLLADNVAPEMARMVLPQSTYTEWYWTGSLAAFARVFNQRSHETAQWEVQQYAEAISSILSKLYPVSWAALTTTE